MQLIVSHNIEDALVLPLGYHHIIQSILFHALEQDAEYCSFMHDVGIGVGKRKYKLFMFSLLSGKYRVKGNEIVFYEKVTFEIRSIEKRFLEMLKKHFEIKGITYGDQHYEDVKAELRDVIPDSEEMVIYTRSPICVYSTDAETKKTIYYHPGDPEFGRRINDSFRRRYIAYYGIEPAEDISIRVESVSPKDKYVTRYKGFYITAWKGTYVLKGKKEYLHFLYQTGLGCKTAQGFGMFEIL